MKPNCSAQSLAILGLLRTIWRMIANPATHYLLRVLANLVLFCSDKNAQGCEHVYFPRDGVADGFRATNNILRVLLPPHSRTLLSVQGNAAASGTDQTYPSTLTSEWLNFDLYVKVHFCECRDNTNFSSR